MKKIIKLLMLVFVMIFIGQPISALAETQYSENVIPEMTSDTLPKGKASASSTRLHFDAYKAFDNKYNSSEGWSSAFQRHGWLEYDFQEPKIITKYAIFTRVGNKGEVPEDWTFEAYDEAQGSWVVLDIQKGVRGWITTEKKEFTFENDKPYERYRINITMNLSYEYVTIAELQMMETITSPSNGKLKVVLGINEQLQLSVDKELAENTNIIWSSSNEDIVRVNENGEVTAVGLGNAVISATSEDGLYTDFVNTLVVPTDELKEHRLAIDLKVGSSCRLTVDDVTDTIKVDWSSMDSSVATITNNGRVTAVRAGLTIIVVTDEQGTEIGQIYIRVRE